MPAELWSEEHTAKYNRLDQHITAIMLSSKKNATHNRYFTWNKYTDLPSIPRWIPRRPRTRRLPCSHYMKHNKHSNPCNHRGGKPQRVIVLHANNLDPASSQSKAYVDDTSWMVNLMHQPNRNPIEDSKLLDNKVFLEGRENIICLRRRIRIIKMCLVCPHLEMGLQEQSTPSGKHRHSSGFLTHLRRQPKGHS